MSLPQPTLRCVSLCHVSSALSLPPQCSLPHDVCILITYLFTVRFLPREGKLQKEDPSLFFSFL